MMRVKGNFKPSIKPLMAILLSLLLILPFFSRITFASQVGTGNFTIEAGQIQGVMLPPKIV
ncbi:MAG TPA: hypothetical protein VLK78_10090, partial [Candidatus Angelobacter sp.]|nr:hypothetical protein [Candidatus Angelobacter sp.]